MLVGFSLPLQQHSVPLIPQAGCLSLHWNAVKTDNVGIGSWNNVESNPMRRRTRKTQLRMNVDYSAIGRWTAGSAIQLTAMSVTLAVLDLSSPILNPALTKVIAVVFFGTMAIRSRIFSVKIELTFLESFCAEFEASSSCVSVCMTSKHGSSLKCLLQPLVCDRPTPKRGSNDWEDVKAAGKPLMDIKRPSCNWPNTTLFQNTYKRTAPV